VVVLAVAASLIRSGRRALVAWSLPVLFVLLCSTILTIGRFNQFGYLSARVIVYVFSAGAPCALAVLLAFADPGWPVSHRAVRRSRRLAAPTVLIAAVVASSVVSAVGFIDRWSSNPTKAYLATLRTELAAHPGAALFDTPLPLRVLPYIEPNRYLSDIVPLIDEHPSFDGASDPQIVDERGHLVPATFVPAAQVSGEDRNAFCDHLVAGRSERVWPLTGLATANEWFLRLDYFQQHASVVHVSLVDARGESTVPSGGSRVILDSTLATTYLRFPQTSPVAVDVRSESPATNLCLTAVQVGYPFPTRGGR
jgi:hypothetical protein